MSYGGEYLGLTVGGFSPQAYLKVLYSPPSFIFYIDLKIQEFKFEKFLNPSHHITW